MAEVYEMLGESVILVGRKDQTGLTGAFYG